MDWHWMMSGSGDGGWCDGVEEQQQQGVGVVGWQ